MANLIAMLILAAAATAVVAHGRTSTKLGRSGSPATELPSLNQKPEDQFAAIKDEYDASVVADWLAGEEALVTLSDAAATEQAREEIIFVLKIVFNLLTLAVLVCGAQRYRSEGIKPLSFRLSAKSAAAEAPHRAKPDPLQGAESNAIDFGPLMQAARIGDRQGWLQLLQLTPGITKREDCCGCTALHVACHCGCAEMVQMLLDLGADVDAKDACEDTALHFAARTGNVEVCKKLLANGADIDATNWQGQTPVLASATAGMEDACELLLNHGGGVSGTADSEIPPMLTMLLFRRMLKPVSVTSVAPRRQQHLQEEYVDWHDDSHVS